MSFRVRIVLNSEVQNLHGRSFVDPVKISICSCCGIDPDSIISIDSDELLYEILCEREVNSIISSIRSEVTDPDSVLNSLGQTRRVFSESKFEIYLNTSSVSPDVVFQAPENTEDAEQEPLPMTTKLSLPPNSTHNPIRVIFVNAGADEPSMRDSDAERSLLIQVPAQLIEADENEPSSVATMLVEIEKLLAKPVPVLPESLLTLKSLLVNYAPLQEFSTVNKTIPNTS
jgi:hypothetical protein